MARSGPGVLPRGARARTAVLAGVAAVLVFAVYAATATTGRAVNDVLSASLASWRIAGTGAPWFDGFPLAAIPTDVNQHLWTGVATNGHVVVFRSPGAIAVGLPPYVVAHLLGAGTDADGFSLLPSALWAAALATATLLLLWRALVRHQPVAHATVAVLALGFTTPFWSVDADSLWTHSLTLLGIAGMAYAGSRDRWWLAGIFGGLALWGRLHMALVVAILGLGLAIWRRQPLIAVKVGVPSSALLVAAAAWSRWMYGMWHPQGPYATPTQYAERASSNGLVDHVVNQAGLWVAPDRGLLVWTPVLVLLLPAVVRAWRSLPDWSRVLAVGGVAYSLVQGLLNGFSGGSGFYGYRLMLECLVCAFPLYALSAHRMGRVAARLVGPVLGLQLAAIGLGAVLNGPHLVETVLWSDNAYVSALRETPALLVLTAALVALGSVLGRAWTDPDLRPTPRAEPRPAAPAAAVGPSLRRPARPAPAHRRRRG